MREDSPVSFSGGLWIPPWMGEERVPEDEVGEIDAFVSVERLLLVVVRDVDVGSLLGGFLVLSDWTSVENGRNVGESSSSSSSLSSLSSEFSSAEESALSRDLALPFVGGKRERRE